MSLRALTRNLLAVVALLALAGPALAGEAGNARSTALDRLFVELRDAKDLTAARTVEQQIWEAWLASGDAGVDGLTRRAIAAMQTSRLEDALATLDAVVSKAPAFAEGWNKRATVLYMLGQYDRSLEDCGKVLALEPRHFGALSGIGLIRIAKGDMAGALLAYRKVIEIYPLSPGARANIEALEKELDGEPL
jgi:tetratricopeptide (TPR) repeat protein